MSPKAKYLYRICDEESWRSKADSRTDRSRRDPVVFLTAGQVRGSFMRDHAGRKNLVLLRSESEAFGDRLRWESRDGAIFPSLPDGLGADDFSFCVGHLPETESGAFLPEEWNRDGEWESRAYPPSRLDGPGSMG